MMCCLLCQKAVEAHDHLFFECSYSMKVCRGLRGYGGMTDVPGTWDAIMTRLVLRAKSKSTFSVIGRLLVAAIAYFIWQERNSRFFNNKLRPPEQLIDNIFATIRLKLHSFKFKDTSIARQVLDIWKIEETGVLMDA